MGEGNVLHTLVVHILSLNNDGADKRIRLLRNRKCLSWEYVGKAIGTSTRTSNANVNWPHVLNGDGVCQALSIIAGSNGGALSLGICRVFGECTSRFSRYTSDYDYICLQGGTIATIVVEVDINMISIFADMTARQFAII